VISESAAGMHGSECFDRRVVRQLGLRSPVAIENGVARRLRQRRQGAVAPSPEVFSDLTECELFI